MSILLQMTHFPTEYTKYNQYSVVPAKFTTKVKTFINLDIAHFMVCTGYSF